MPQTFDLNGAELIARYLDAHGVTQVAGTGPALGGDALMPLYRALKGTRVRHVAAHHEQSAGFIAQGMARIGGRAGVCLAGSAAGVATLLPAMADANADSVPLVAICALTSHATRGAETAPPFRTGYLVDPISKVHFDVRAVDDLVEALPEAFRIAQSGRPGPVVIEVARDALSARIKLDQLPAPAAPLPAPAPDPAAIARAAAMIDAARQPVLYLGGGVTRARAQAAALRLAERADLPVTTSLMALGALAHDHPLALGMLGLHGTPAANQALARCDLLLAIGTRFDVRATGCAERFAPHAQVIHVDIDARELGRLRRADLAIEADADAALRLLADAVRPARRVHWLESIRALQRAPQPPPQGTPALRRPERLIRAVAAALGCEAIVSADAGAPQRWVAQHYPLTPAHRWLSSGGLGSRGFALPAAIGGALAAPQAPVLCCIGADSLLTSLQDLATLAEQQLNVKLLVFDAPADGATPALGAIAHAVGVAHCDLGLARDPGALLRSALQQPGPMLIRAPVESDTPRTPLLAPETGAATVLRFRAEPFRHTSEVHHATAP